MRGTSSSGGQPLIVLAIDRHDGGRPALEDLDDPPELGRLTLPDALELVVLYAEKDWPKYARLRLAGSSAGTRATAVPRARGVH